MLTVEETIKRQMSKASKARTAESRKQGGTKAWKTRIQNLLLKLAQARKTISGDQAGKKPGESPLK
jgi:hypothetical protein